MTSSVMYYSPHARQNEIYLLNTIKQLTQDEIQNENDFKTQNTFMSNLKLKTWKLIINFTPWVCLYLKFRQRLAE